MKKNNIKYLIISKVLNKLAICNLNRLYNINLSSNLIFFKYDIESTLLGSMTIKIIPRYSFMDSNNDKIFNFQISTN
jgi:hypothetical protein